MEKERRLETYIYNENISNPIMAMIIAHNISRRIIIVLQRESFEVLLLDWEAEEQVLKKMKSSLGWSKNFEIYFQIAKNLCSHDTVGYFNGGVDTDFNILFFLGLVSLPVSFYIFNKMKIDNLKVYNREIQSTWLRDISWLA